MANDYLHDDRDVEQILKLAVNRAGYSDEEALRQRLMAAASELGLTEAQVKAAEEEYRLQRERMAEEAEYQAYVRKEFWEHAWSYILVNAGLVAFNLFTKSHIGWAIWPLIGWGIGIAFHAFSTFARNSTSYQGEFEAWRKARGAKIRRRHRRAAERDAKLAIERNGTSESRESNRA